MSGASVRQFVEILKRPLEEMPAELALMPLAGAFDVAIRPPGSKSLTNRALLMAALADGESVIRYPLLEADDARVMVAALRTLGVGVEIDGDGTAWVRGCGGRLKGNCTLNLNNAGTATRFLTAAACLADGPVVLDGNARMRQRPIGELRAMLRNLGVQVDELGHAGCVPLRVIPASVQGGVMDVGSMLSSQFVSAVMMVSPYFKLGLEMRFTEAVTSPAYIEMTARLMRETGYAVVEGSCAERRVRVAAGLPRAIAYDVEADASGATYFLGAAAVAHGSRCAIEGMPTDSLQGDAAFAGVLDRMRAGAGGLRGVEADLSLMPDTAMTLAAVACFAEGTTTIRGLRTLRVKETDRIAAIVTELAKVGVAVEVFSYTAEDGAADEGVRITPPPAGIHCSAKAPTVVFETYDDHRMAMSLALIGLRRPNVVIRDPGCVAKTYPGFWRDWALLYEN